MLRKLKQLATQSDRLTRRSGDAAHLSPILVDSTGRDGGTLMMRLLSTSPEIAAPGPYPYEKKYFAYLWRWSRLLERRDQNDWWTQGDLASLAQEAGKPLIGPAPWSSHLLRAAGAMQPSMSRQMFDLAWSEFSRRAANQVREKHGDPNAEVRYYAEKHQDTWLVDLDQLPPLNVLVLLRDPRDTFVSFHAYHAIRRERGGVFEAALPSPGETPEERTTRFIERERERLRWIAGLASGQKFPLFRYEDLVANLPRQARRLEDWLSVRLDPEVAAGDTEMRGLHVTAQTPEASVGRWKREMPREVVELFNRELGEELEVLGY
ncbi:MAG: sulfotransferase domain-containing protein [Actinomycetota bacterium]